MPDWAREALPKLPQDMADSDRVASAADRGAVSLAEAVLLAQRVGEVFEAGVLDVDTPAKGVPGGTVAIDDPAVRARCLGELPLGERVAVRLTVADPARREVRFERA